jgi:serine phosphatase RsbU (regulator of sigma subunit)
MREQEDLLKIVQTVLGTFDNRQSFSPGMFEPLKPLFEKLGYASFAVYMVDDYPDRMHLVCGYGGVDIYPSYIAKARRDTLFEELGEVLADVPGLLTGRLYSHGRELGALAVTTRKPPSRRLRDAFTILAQTMSIMAYVERIRTNDKRERQEREIFFAQSLTTRLLIREVPRIGRLRLGIEFMRSLEAGGDFFDMMPAPHGGLIGYIGSCNGRGLRTVLEVTSIMREAHRACPSARSLSDVLLRVNDHLVREKRRAHQASMCVFEVDTRQRRLRLAKAGRLGLLLGGRGSGARNVSAPGGLFLGMVDKPKIRDEEYEFNPGQSLFCFTEGLYSSRNFLNVSPSIHWFLQAVEATLETRPKLPLARAVFANLGSAADHWTRPEESMLALSVEFTGR